MPAGHDAFHGNGHSPTGEEKRKKRKEERKEKIKKEVKRRSKEGIIGMMYESIRIA